MKPTIYKEVTKGHYDLLKEWYNSPNDLPDDTHYIPHYDHTIAMIELLITLYEKIQSLESTARRDENEN